MSKLTKREIQLHDQAVCPHEQPRSRSLFWGLT